MTRTQAQRAIQSAADVLASAHIFNPGELREAAAYLRTTAFTPETDEQEVATAIANFWVKCADQQERAMRKAFQK